jgi:beta-lactamase class A
MPSRRPYASRGVPRRATTRGSNGAPSAARFRTFAAVLLIVLVSVGLAARTFLSGPPQTMVPVASGQGLADAAPASGAAPVLDMDAIATPAVPGSAQRVQPSPTKSISLTRAWDADAAGVSVDPALVEALDQALSGVQGHVSVAVKDLGSGRGAVLDGDQELASASLYKLPVLYTVFDLGLAMSEPLVITDEALSFDSGTMELGAGETLTVAEALERMVTLSDNTSAILLGDRVGAGHVNASIAALGMDTTHYSVERMTTSASDMLHFLDLVAHGKAVSSAASADMLRLMLRQRVNDRLPRLLPDEAQVAHKTGNLPGTVNDVGIIYGPSSTVAVAALVSDTPDETAAATGIARVGLAAYSYFESQPEEPNRPLIPRAPTRAIPPVRREPHPVPTPTPTVEAVVEPTPDPTPEPTLVPAVTSPTPARVPAATVGPIRTPATVPTPQPTRPAQTVPTATVAPTPIPATSVPPTTAPTPVPPRPTAAPTRPPAPATPTLQKH